ncbi:MAG: hypothetical protein HOE12_06510 [Gammaproteobacteria bacterium]|jgi:hypothetical protein|nr:hypothetical protein [Gammaproteobacteria bacterium]
MARNDSRESCPYIELNYYQFFIWGSFRFQFPVFQLFTQKVSFSGPAPQHPTQAAPIANSALLHSHCPPLELFRSRHSCAHAPPSRSTDWDSRATSLNTILCDSLSGFLRIFRDFYVMKIVTESSSLL